MCSIGVVTLRRLQVTARSSRKIFLTTNVVLPEFVQGQDQHCVMSFIVTALELSMPRHVCVLTHWPKLFASTVKLLDCGQDACDLLSVRNGMLLLFSIAF